MSRRRWAKEPMRNVSLKYSDPRRIYATRLKRSKNHIVCVMLL